MFKPPKCFGIIVFAILALSSTAALGQSVYLVSPANGATEVSIPAIFTWSQSGMEYFWIQIDDNSDFSSPVIDNNYITTLTYTANSLVQNTVYYWRINGHVYDTWGGYWRGFTDTWSFTTECPRPGAPVLVAPPNGSDEVERPVYFDWQDIFNAFEYEIQIDDNSDFSSVTVGFYTSLSNYTTASLAQNTYYFWRIRARFNNSCGWGNWSAVWSLQTECPLPAQASLVYPANNATDLEAPLLLDWTDISLADYYHVMLDDDPFFGSPEVDYEFAAGFSDYTVADLDKSTTYYWKVLAYNSCGDNGWSVTRNFSTACPRAAAPSTVLPMYGATGLTLPVTFTWSDSPDNTTYRLQIDDGLDFGDVLFDILLAPVYQYEVNFILAPGQTYYWRIRAENDCGWSVWSEASTFSMNCPGITVPILVSPENGSDDRYLPIILDWDDVPNATLYRVMVDENPAFGSPIIDYTFPAGPSYFYPEGLTEATTYHWKVKAFDDCDQSDWSEVRSFRAKRMADCGDVNYDDNIDILDVIHTINYIYKGGDPPCPPEE